MRWLRIFKKHIFWKTVVYAIGIYLALFLVVVISLRIYTQHGQTYPVPDFKGLNPERMQEVALMNDLKIEIVDSSFVPYLPKGSVIEQYPQPGIGVKKNRTIFLTINAFNQAKVEMPNLVGVSFRQGKTLLESKGLKVGKLIYEPDFAKNNILRQLFQGKKIMPGTMIERGQLIDLALGNGNRQSSYPIPNLIRLKYNKALNEISDSYFNIGVVTFDATIESYTDTLNAMVWKQRPAYFEDGRAVMGSRFDIWLTLDLEEIPSPDTLPE
ncbi:MAG: PASTA domain-containing protein [Salinivirgaceae bacterium]|jgi:beta-lactam-binding protein with PASTA domain